MATLPDNFDDQVDMRRMEIEEAEIPQEEDVSLLGDLAMAPFRGGLDAVQDVYGLLDFVTADALPDWNVNPLGDSKTTAGKAFQGISNFLVGFVPGLGAAKWLGVAGKATKAATALGMTTKAAKVAGNVTQAAAAGAAADFAVFDGHEARLSDLIEDSPLANPVTEFLASDAEDSELVGRLKNTLEGIGLGIMTDSLLGGLRGIKAMRKAQKQGQGAAEAYKAIDKDKIFETKSFEFDGGTATAVKERPLKDLDVSDDVANILGKKTVLRKTDDMHVMKVDDLADFDSLKQSVRKKLETDPDARMAMGKNLDDILEKVSHDTNIPKEQLVANASLLASNTDDIANEILATGASVEIMQREVRALAKQAVTSESTRDLASLAEAMKNLEAGVYAYRRTASNQGRSLRAIRTVNDRVDILSNPTRREKFLFAHGGKNELLAHARKLATIEDTGAFVNFIRKSKRNGTKVFQATQEFWVNSILSGPTTQVVNTLSNTINTFYRPLEGIVGSVLAGDARTAKTFMSQLRYTFQVMDDASKAAFRVLKTGKNIFDVNSTTFRETTRRAISGEAFGATGTAKAVLDTVGGIVNLPGRFLMTTDEFFKQVTARSRIMAQLERRAIDQGLTAADDIAKKVADDLNVMMTGDGAVRSQASVLEDEALRLAKEQGIEGSELSKFVTEHLQKNREVLDLDSLAREGLSEARAVTFQTPLGNGFAGSLRDMTIRHPALGFALPFITTPTNLLKFAFKRMPGISLLSSKMQKELLSEIPEVAARARGRQAMGTMFVGTAGILALQGKITGSGPEDIAERKILMETGWRPYSLNIGDEYYSFGRAEPFATFFGIVADMADVWKRGDREGAETGEKLLNATIVALSENITNKSYLQGIATAMDLITGGDYGRAATARRFAGSFVPNLFAKFKGTAGDDNLREVRTSLDAILGKIPGATDVLPPRRNILGEEVTDTTKGMFLDAKWINPYLKSAKSNDKVFDELARYGSSLKNPSTTYNGIDLLQVTDDNGRTAFDIWMERVGQTRIKGKTLRQALDRLMNTRKYRNLTDEIVPGIENPRVNAIRRTISQYRAQARVEAFSTIPTLEETVRAMRQAQAQARRGGSIRAFLERQQTPSNNLLGDLLDNN